LDKPLRIFVHQPTAELQYLYVHDGKRWPQSSIGRFRAAFPNSRATPKFRTRSASDSQRLGFSEMDRNVTFFKKLTVG
jgi:hypothetical protein